MYIRKSSFGTFDDTTLHKHWLDIHFPLVMNIAAICNIELYEIVYSEYWGNRVGSRWYPMFLRQIQWRMLVPPMESSGNGCLSPPDCHCQTHAGRSSMARDRNAGAWQVLPVKKPRRHRLATRLFP